MEFKSKICLQKMKYKFNIFKGDYRSNKWVLVLRVLHTGVHCLINSSFNLKNIYYPDHYHVLKTRTHWCHANINPSPQVIKLNNISNFIKSRRTIVRIRGYLGYEICTQGFIVLSLHLSTSKTFIILTITMFLRQGHIGVMLISTQAPNLSS
ncbi:hypothetical protein V8G54_007472 [Vigna mungo]|uniref:Uncharacterized protein n=1 Tax=Vigna mungo TaxID=3915 RepID=A0AAQ3P1X9_VIGMU